MRAVIPALALLVVIAAIVLVISQTPAARRKRGAKASASLERQYTRMLHMPPRVAEETTQRILAEMKRDFPGHTRQWYLKKMIADLRRDRQ